MKTISVFFIIISLFITAEMRAENENPEKKTNPAVVAEQTLSIKGRVIDINSREGLAGAEITVKAAGIKAFTDLEGYFEISGLTPGNYTLICSMISYNASLLENLEIKPGNDKIEIALEEIK
ncbi:MAG: carboxypeptidase-like regulatory domain-containing protein [Bacteroidales bacterium]